MNIIIIDLEWNGAPLYRTGGYFNEIIEIGAVKLGASLEQLSTFQTLVKPTVHKKLTGRVKRLTHISNDEVRSATTFKTTYERFAQWVGTEDNCFMSWGTGDIMVMLENLEHYHLPATLSMIHSYCDAQALCQQVLEIEKAKQPGLSAVAEQLGIKCEDMDMHRALDDSLVSAQCVRRVWREEVFNSLRRPFNEEFIQRLLFKPYFITDMRNSAVTQASLEQNCPECGRHMVRESEPISRNRHINIIYYCASCDRRIIGRHQFRKHFDGVAHKVLWREFPPPEETREDAETDTAEQSEGQPD